MIPSYVRLRCEKAIIEGSCASVGIVQDSWFFNRPWYYNASIHHGVYICRAWKVNKGSKREKSLSSFIKYWTKAWTKESTSIIALKFERVIEGNPLIMQNYKHKNKIYIDDENLRLQFLHLHKIIQKEAIWALSLSLARNVCIALHFKIVVCHENCHIVD